MVMDKSFHRLILHFGLFILHKIDRLTHAKLMIGGFDSLNWNDDVSKDFVCDKPSCYSSSTTQTIDYYDYICYQGHFPINRLMDAASTGNKSSHILDTNENTMESSNPTSATTDDYTMSYIYDNFNWSHCKDFLHGEDDFETLFSTTCAKAKSSLSFFNSIKLTQDRS